MRPVARRLQSLNNRVFNRITRDQMRAALASLGLSAGDAVWAHVSMRRIGFVTGGPAEAVLAILDVIKDQGTLMLSAFPRSDPSKIDPADLFDVAATPSGSGLLSEAARHLPGARRSRHPIASVVAIGARADELVGGHENSATPFGPDTPFGRLARMQPKLLLVGAHLGGVIYHVQDRVGFPNLYSSKPARFDVRDEMGRHHQVPSLVPRSDVPPVVILPGSRPENRDYILVPDYALMFPPERERLVLEAGYLRFNRSRFLGRRERLQARGILKLGQVGSAEAALLDGVRMLDQIAKDLSWDINRFKEEYDAEQLSGLSLPVL